MTPVWSRGDVISHWLESPVPAHAVVAALSPPYPFQALEAAADADGGCGGGGASSDGLSPYFASTDVSYEAVLSANMEPRVLGPVLQKLGDAGFNTARWGRGEAGPGMDTGKGRAGLE